jgi:protein-tyrosine phosphatase
MSLESKAELLAQEGAIPVAPGTIDLGGSFAQHRITGWSNIGGHRIDCPLVSHVEGNLYQGGCMDGIPLPDEFEHVVSLYKWEKYKLPEGCTRDTFEMFDSVDQNTEAVEEIADLAWRAVQRGKTLVHCQAGLNRSGLIAGRVLMHMGYTADEAIEKLRRRSPAVLCNPTFEAYLRAV